MKSIPWNRFTKHLCVLVFLALIAGAYFYSRFLLLPIVLLFIPLEHRIERDYRSTREKCPRCRRWKPKDEFDITVCKACVAQDKHDRERIVALAQVRPSPLPSVYPGLDKFPPKPAAGAFAHRH